MDANRQKYVDKAMVFAFEMTEATTTTGGRYEVAEYEDDTNRVEIIVTRNGESSACFWVDLVRGIVRSSATDQEVMYL